MHLPRRDQLRWGIVLGGGAALSGGGRVSRADNLPPSPPTRPFAVELTRANGGIPPIARPVTPFPTQPDPAHCVNVTAPPRSTCMVRAAFRPRPSTT